MLKNSNKFIACLLSIVILWNGCSSGPEKEYTAQQKQQLETSVIEGSYNNVFNATRTVFLNSGLVLQQIDKDSGFINGVLTVKKKHYLGLGLILFGILGIIMLLIFKDNFFGKENFDITATLVDLNNNSVEVRLQTPLLEKQSNQYGVALKRIFAEIKKQTMILEAAGRT
jgi:hypothetical protein